jgi:predicted nucleotide-binding protein
MKRKTHATKAPSGQKRKIMGAAGMKKPAIRTSRTKKPAIRKSSRKEELVVSAMPPSNTTTVPAAEPAVVRYKDSTIKEDPEEIMGNAMALFIQSIFASMIQDIPAAEKSAAEATELCNELKQITDEPDLQLFVDYFGQFIGAFGSYGWVIKALNEGRFSMASERVGKLRQDFEASLEHLNADMNSVLSNNELFQIWSEILTAFKWVFIETEEEIRIQSAVFQGKLTQYRNGLKNLATYFDKAAEAIKHPNLLQMKTSFHTQADQRRARSEFFELHPLRFLDPPTEKKLFLIHGRDEGAWRALEAVIIDVGWTVIELARLPGRGMTLIEKLEHYALDCSYAIGLFTPDDFVKENGKDYAQARPNVLLELGWFYGRYGRGHATIVCKKGTTIPSDLLGVLRVEYHERVEEVREELKRELEAALAGDTGN